MFTGPSTSPVFTRKKKRNRTLLTLIFLVVCFDLLLRSFTFTSPNSDLSQLGVPHLQSLHFKDFFNNKPIYMIGDEAALYSFSYETAGYSLQLNKHIFPCNEILNRAGIGFNSTIWANESLEFLKSIKNAGLIIINIGTEEALNGGDLNDFAKSLQGLLYLFRQSLPNVSLAAITPMPPLNDSDLDRLKFVRTDVQVFGQKFMVPVFDLWQVFNLDPVNYQSKSISAFLSTPVKFNANANALIAAKLYEFLSTKMSGSSLDNRQVLYTEIESPKVSKLSQIVQKFLPTHRHSPLQGSSYSLIWGTVSAVIIGLLIGDLIVRLFPWHHTGLDSNDYNNAPIILLGDSITQYGYSTEREGWTSLMSCAYALRYDVLNRGHWGYNTDAYVNRIQKTIKKALGTWNTPTLVTLMIGTNDAEPSSRKTLYVPIERYKENLKSIISDILEFNTQRLILITPPPTRKSRQPDNRFRYRQAMIEIAKDFDLLVMDTWSVFLLNRTLGEMSWDDLDSVTMGHYNDSIMENYLIDEEHYNVNGNHQHWHALSNMIKSFYPDIWPWDGCI